MCGGGKVGDGIEASFLKKALDHDIHFPLDSRIIFVHYNGIDDWLNGCWEIRHCVYMQRNRVLRCYLRYNDEENWKPMNMEVNEILILRSQTHDYTSSEKTLHISPQICKSASFHCRTGHAFCFPVLLPFEPLLRCTFGQG